MGTFYKQNANTENELSDREERGENCSCLCDLNSLHYQEKTEGRTPAHRTDTGNFLKEYKYNFGTPFCLSYRKSFEGQCSTNRR